jgi:hypothetical protein
VSFIELLQELASVLVKRVCRGQARARLNFGIHLPHFKTQYGSWVMRAVLYSALELRPGGGMPQTDPILPGTATSPDFATAKSIARWRSGESGRQGVPTGPGQLRVKGGSRKDEEAGF